MERHFTATVYVFHESRVLLHRHKKLGKWLPPGGHVEKNELPHEAAKREALEESGLEIEILSQENIQANFSHAISIPRPFACLLEEIPQYKEFPKHQHIDMIYLSRLSGSQTEPIAPFTWLTYEESQQIHDSEMFADVRLILDKVFQKEFVGV